MMTPLLDIAKRVKKGVRLLNRRVPGWRKTMKEHAAEFNIKKGSFCVLGTLEHYNGRMQTLNTRRVEHLGYPSNYWRGEARLNLQGEGKDYGFNANFGADHDNTEVDAEFEALQALWRAEFEA